jgi:PBSX family phage terminase large subunit
VTSDITMLPLSRKQLYSIAEAEARFNLWEGAIRSGKTFGSMMRWLMFLADPPPGGQFVMVGRTRESLARNVIAPMQDPDIFGEFADTVKYVTGAPSATILGRRVYMLGASDAKAEKSLRGLTVAGAYADEVTVIREDFFNQLLGRMSVDGAKLFGTTNPDNPEHWLKKKYLDRLDELPDWRSWHFTLDDNPALSEDYKNSIKREYTGLWYRRFILGHWVAADGAVYDMWEPSRHIVKWENLPQMVELFGVGVDYGTTNPTAALLLGLGIDGVLYLIDEWRYQPRSDATRWTDAQLSKGLRDWLAVDHLPPDKHGRPQRLAQPPVIVDPAAASFRVQLRADGLNTYAAENDVLYGIRTKAMLLSGGKLKVSDRCKGFLTEVAGYSWDSEATDAGYDQVLKTSDHSLDAARYAIVTTERRWRQYINIGTGHKAA